MLGRFPFYLQNIAGGRFECLEYGSNFKISRKSSLAGTPEALSQHHRGFLCLMLWCNHAHCLPSCLPSLLSSLGWCSSHLSALLPSTTPHFWLGGSILIHSSMLLCLRQSQKGQSEVSQWLPRVLSRLPRRLCLAFEEITGLCNLLLPLELKPDCRADVVPSSLPPTCYKFSLTSFSQQRTGLFCHLCLSER